MKRWGKTKGFGFIAPDEKDSNSNSGGGDGGDFFVGHWSLRDARVGAARTKLYKRLATAGTRVQYRGKLMLGRV